jgi:hypothetical protein
MNLNFTYKTNHIENFINIDATSDKLEAELKRISASSCSNIIISESINYLNYDESKTTLVEIISKLRKGGNISISTVDFDAISTNFINGDIDIPYLCNILSSIKSIIPNQHVISLVKDHNVKIISIEKRDFLFIIRGYRENT